MIESEPMGGDDRDADEVNVSLRGRPSEAEVTLKPRVQDAEGVAVQLRRAALYQDGRRIPIPPSGMTIGSAVTDRVRVHAASPSERGSVIPGHNGGFEYLDSGANATVNGIPVGATPRPLVTGDVIEVRGQRFVFETRSAPDGPQIAPPVAPTSISTTSQRIILGRTESSDVTLHHPSVSMQHAEVVSGPRGAQLRDLSRSGGTLLNGSLVREAPLQRGDEIGIGPYRLTFDGEALVEHRMTDAGLLIQVEGVGVDAGNRTILQPTWLTIEPGELVAIVGESGAGKTTLMKRMAGVADPTRGRVLVNGEDVALRQSEIAYVPQDDIVHSRLTVREALGYSAALRLPPDSTSDDRTHAVERVIAEVELGQHAHTYISSLSGGQRKRVNVASELVVRPGLVFLDEPTTGLDPGLERRMMELLRSLADYDRTVLLVTHATRSLSLCDRMIVLARGGYLAFCGRPEDALTFFGVDHPDDIYEALERRTPAAWHSTFGASGFNTEDQTPSATQPVRPAIPRRSAARQVRPLTSRYLKLLRRDRRNLFIVAAQAVLLGLATALLFKTDVFNRLPTGQKAQRGFMHVGESAQLLFLLVTVAIWFGAIAAAREVVKERSVLTREIAVGVRIRAYLASKLLPLCAIVGVQTLVLTVIALALRRLHDGAGGQLALLLVVTSWVGVAMGLAISTSVRSEDQATSFIPLALIPQLLFGGAIVAVAQMAGVMQVISGVFFARWAFAASGTLIGMADRIQSDLDFARANKYGDDFFTVGLAQALVILATFIVVFVSICAWQIRRSTRPTAGD